MSKFLIIISFFFLGVTISGCDIFTKKTSYIEPVNDSMTIVFSGDFMQHMPQVQAAKVDSGYDYRYSLGSISKLWRSCDFAVVNLETTIVKAPPYTGYPMFGSPEAIIDALEESGVDVLALANNHICDKQTKGLSNTLQTIEKRKLKYIGAYKKTDTINYVVLTKNDLKVAIFNYTYGTNGMPIPRDFEVNLIDTIHIKRTLNNIAKDSVNKVVAFFHWGDEYQLKPNSTQVDLVEWCRKNGVDYVIGSHPHVVQPIDTLNKVVYSLGNLVSNQSKRYQDGGISVKLTLFRDSIKCQFVPHWVDRKDRYKILLPFDTLENCSAQFLQSLEDSRKNVEKANELTL